MEPIYICDCCGACCRSKLVDVYEIDLRREPRINRSMSHLREPGMDGEIGYLNCISGDTGCGFLDGESRCEIYPTRPSVCVMFEAGSEDCQECRVLSGIPRLQPEAD